MAIRLMRSEEVVRKLQEAFGTYHRQGFYTHVRKGNIVPHAVMHWRPGRTANLFTEEEVNAFIAKIKARRGL